MVWGSIRRGRERGWRVRVEMMIAWSDLRVGRGGGEEEVQDAVWSVCRVEE